MRHSTSLSASLLLLLASGKRFDYVRLIEHSMPQSFKPVCLTQVVDMNDPDTPYLAKRMSPALRGKIIEVKSCRSAATAANEQSCVNVVSRVNQALDRLLGEDGEELRRRRHESIAGAVQLVNSLKPASQSEYIHGDDEHGNSIEAAQVEAQNLFSGAVITGSLPLIESLLKQHSDKMPSGPVGVKGTTPYFHRPSIDPCRSQGHLEVVRHLFSYDARLDSAYDPRPSQRVPLIQEDWRESWNSHKVRGRFTIQSLQAHFEPLLLLAMTTSCTCYCVRSIGCL